MKKISLKDVKNGLKRDEMRMISGGSGTCCAKAPGYETWCGMSYSAARAYTSGGGRWCCDGCGTASWV